MEDKDENEWINIFVAIVRYGLETTKKEPRHIPARVNNLGIRTREE